MLALAEIFSDEGIGHGDRVPVVFTCRAFWKEDRLISLYTTEEMQEKYATRDFENLGRRVSLSITKCVNEICSLPTNRGTSPRTPFVKVKTGQHT